MWVLLIENFLLAVTQAERVKVFPSELSVNRHTYCVNMTARQE